jgi:hypothetical protein
MKTRLCFALVPVAALALMVGCSSSSNTGVPATPKLPTARSSPSSSTASSMPAGSESGAPSGEAPVPIKVSANTASEAAIAAAFAANGVDNPERWAKEVVEYRPYDATDTSMKKVRQNLAKYNPSTDTVEKIVAVLQP